jgi:hypothetical protein
MSWAERRQKLISAILILLGAAVIAVVVIAVLYKAPSCSDNKQDQGEQGIDCGGPCPYLCVATERAPSVRFIRPVSPQPGRTDVIAYIDNLNPNATLQEASYTIQLYGPAQDVVASKTGIVSLPPDGTVPLFIPDFYLGNKPVTTAFLTIDPSSIKWLRNSATPILPEPTDIQIQNTRTPKVTAMLKNPTGQPIYNETVIATVFDARNNAIAASQTIVPILTPEGSASIVFTWNQAFSAKPVRVEILPATGS